MKPRFHAFWAINGPLETHPLNSLLLESAPAANGAFTARFQAADELDSVALQLVFADDISSLIVNGKSLPLENSGEGSAATFSGAELSGANLIRFHPAQKTERPFVWLKVLFRIQSQTPFVAGPNHNLRTNGPFSVRPARNGLARNLVADGFPFLQTELTANAEVEFSEAISVLRFNGVEADAVHLNVDGKNFGWSGRPHGEIKFANQLSAGKHRLKIRLVPNSFNGFGPHHYYLGDGQVISPDQFRGVKNFADAPDAPLKTHIAAWHFRRFQLSDSISAL
jgi:hypothetical protein